MEFLSDNFEVVLFTRENEIKTEASLTELNLNQAFDHKLYEQHCTTVKINATRRLTRDLSKIGRLIGRVIVIENKHWQTCLQQENVIAIEPWSADE